MSVNGADLVFEARKLLGSPYYHSGRDPATGLDCCGLILVPAQRLVLTTYEPDNYSPTGWYAYLVQGIEQCCRRVDLETGLAVYEAHLPAGQALLKPADVLLFSRRGKPSHLAYYSGEGRMLHLDMKANAVVEVPITEWDAKQLMSVWRWKGLAEC